MRRVAIIVGVLGAAVAIGCQVRIDVGGYDFYQPPPDIASSYPDFSRLPDLTTRRDLGGAGDLAPAPHDLAGFDLGTPPG